jgi:hypothetical protein
MATYENKDRVALFTADKGPASLSGLITVGGIDYRCKLMKAHPNERGAGYLSIELKDAPYTVVGGGFLMPSKQPKEGGAILYGTLGVQGLSYKVNLYRADPGKSYVLSGPIRLADDNYTKPAATKQSGGDSGEW